jgi:hypothetical protein
MADNIMAYQKVLPENFNGTFYFSNWTDEDLTVKWNNKEYTFPKGTMSPMPAAALNATPLEVQQIRKKFAMDGAQREYFKGSLENGYATLLKQERNPDGTPRLNSFHSAGTYSVDTLTPYIQKFLEPLPESRVKVAEAPKVDMEDRLSKDEEGEVRTRAVSQGMSLKEKALKGERK